MSASTAIVGASGYTGAQLLRLLADHPELQVDHVMSHSDDTVDSLVSDLYPALGPAYPSLRFASLDLPELESCSVVFLCLPHGLSQEYVPELLPLLEGGGGHIVDIGSDFRLNETDYKDWYGKPHTQPYFLEDFAYGIPELFRSRIAEKQHVANPGCYPTATGLALAPLFAQQRPPIDPTTIVVNALSGISGRGHNPSRGSLYAEANESVSAYSLFNHRHTAEIEMILSDVADLHDVAWASDLRVLFTPHLVPSSRGIYATCWASRIDETLTTESLTRLYADFYRDEPFIRVTSSDQPPQMRTTTGSNSVEISVGVDHRTNSIVVIACEDNLVKGASGQAIQNANLLLGFDEGVGLPRMGIVP